MRLPLFVIGLSGFLTLVLILLTSNIVGAILFFVAILSFVVLVFISRNNELLRRNLTSVIIACGAIAFFSMNYLLREYVVYDSAIQFSNMNVTVVGDVIKILNSNGSTNSGSKKRYLVNVCELTDKASNKIGLPKRGLKILLISNELGCEIGDTVTFKSRIKMLGENDIQIRNYYKSQNVYLGATAYTVKCNKNKSTNNYLVQELANKVNLYAKSILCKYLPDEYAYVSLGMLIGDKSEVKKEYLDLFKKVGIVHLFSVSGFHVSLFSMLIYRALLRTKMSPKFCSAFCIGFLVCFVIITGFSKSTLRASLMLGVFFVGRMISADADSLNSLGLAITLIILLNPFAVGDSGLLLSVCATLGILTIPKIHMKRIKHSLKKIGNISIRQKLNEIVSLLAVSISALVSTTPVLLLFSSDSSKLSLASPVSNLFITLVAELAILLSAIGILVSPIPILNSFCYSIFFTVGHCVKYIICAAKLITRIPFCSVQIDSDYLKFTMACIAALAAFSLIIPIRDDSTNERTKFTLQLSIIIILGAVLSNSLCQYLLFILPIN